MFRLIIEITFNAPLAQLAEQLTLNQRVVGSSPTWRNQLRTVRGCRGYAGMGLGRLRYGSHACAKVPMCLRLGMVRWLSHRVSPRSSVNEETSHHAQSWLMSARLRPLFTSCYGGRCRMGTPWASSGWRRRPIFSVQFTSHMVATSGRLLPYSGFGLNCLRTEFTTALTTASQLAVTDSGAKASDRHLLTCVRLLSRLLLVETR